MIGTLFAEKKKERRRNDKGSLAGKAMGKGRERP